MTPFGGLGGGYSGNYCNLPRDDGMSCAEHVAQLSPLVLLEMAEGITVTTGNTVTVTENPLSPVIRVRDLRPNRAAGG